MVYRNAHKPKEIFLPVFTEIPEICLTAMWAATPKISRKKR